MRTGTPAEFETHEGTIIMFPFRNDIWRKNAVPVQQLIYDLVEIISKYEHVYFICRNQDVENINSKHFNNTTIIPMDYDDIWARDIAPTFIYNKSQLECIDWKFNAWGGKKEGSYFPWNSDDKFASNIANYLGFKSKRINIILEGGALLSDGNGTLFTTRSVLLNRNRNPFKSKNYIEDMILTVTGDKKLVWLNRGLAYDETNGHIDNLMSVVSSSELCLAWTDDKKNPNYKRVRTALDTLKSITNLKGEKYKINLVPLPPRMLLTEAEAMGIEYNQNALMRDTTFSLPASYLNYYLLNGAVLLPSFGCEEDERVKKQFETIFPNREIIQIYCRELLIGGGGLHCILKEIPKE